MGVPKFFRYISERYPCLSELVKDYQLPEFDNLYLDMNGIIHMCSHPDDNDPHFRITEEKIFKDIFHYIEVLFSMIKPKKIFFMAVDGVAPRAKMNQQRGRRFNSAKDAEKMEEAAKKKGEVLPTEARFDSNCITPGTVFMARLQEQLQYFVAYKISTDKMWSQCKIILSGHDTPGEGEHKIMDYIRYIRAQPGHDPNTRHCLYGLDADLIMLGLCTHEPHFSLLREEVKFGKKSTKRKNVPEEINFFLLHLSLMREYLELEFLSVKDKLSFKFDIESIIDDWVLMGFLVGNDFIPHLPYLHIANGALPILYNTYIKILPSLGGYINESGTLNLERFEKFMEELASVDTDHFTEQYADLKYFEAKTGRRMNETDKSPLKNNQNSAEANVEDPNSSVLDGELEEELCELELDSGSDTDDKDLFDEEFRLHKRDYYMNKLEYQQVTPEVLRDQAEGYVKAIQWNLHYYYNGCCSWSWYYPHHYAPYISDIKGFTHLKIEFELGKPFRPYEQLLGVLPAASKNLLPSCYHDLMTNEESPIKQYYPEEFRKDLNGKKQDWEAVVLVPFIDEKILLDVMEPYNTKLTLEEIKRNTHGPMRVYSYTEEDLGEYPAPSYFPQIKSNHAKCDFLSIEDIRVPIEKLVKGAYPGVKLDIYYPGFPTLKHLKYTGTLDKAKVKVFEQPSRGDNMIIKIIHGEYESDLLKNLLGSTVYVGWPHMVEALVVSVADEESRYHSIPAHPGQYNVEDNKGDLKSQWVSSKQGTIEHYKNRLGIDVGKTEILVYAKVMIGRKYMYTTSHGRVNLEKQWAEVPSCYPLQTIVRNISAHDSHHTTFTDLKHIFPAGSECFMLGLVHYGSKGTVKEDADALRKGRITVNMLVTNEPDLSSIQTFENEINSQYMNLFLACSKLSIAKSVFSRITGTVFVTSRNQTSDTQNSHKLNVGLNLKFNVKNMETPGFTKKINNNWMYSDKTVQLVKDYMEFCPNVFECLNYNPKADSLFKEDIFPEDSDERLKELDKWLKSKPHFNAERQVCGTSNVDPEVVRKIEETVDNYKKAANTKHMVMQIKPHLLYKSDLQVGSLVPDPQTTYELYDRIVNVREGYTVPLGLKGTIIAIRKMSDSDDMYDIVFDESFPGGLELNCSSGRGYRLQKFAFINISHGKRALQEKTGKPGQLMEILRAANNQTGVRNNDMGNNSAFASWKKPGPSSSGAPNVAYQMPTYYKPYNATNTSDDNRYDQYVPKEKLNTYQNVSKPSISKSSVQEKDHPAVMSNPKNVRHRTLRGGGEYPVANEKNPVNSPQQRSRAVCNTEFLKKILKIDNPPQDKTQEKEERRQLPPSSANKAPANEAVKSDNSYYSMKLLSYYQSNGLGCPQYQYCKTLDQQFVAQIALPDGKTVIGKPAENKAHASELVAEKVYKLITKTQPKDNNNSQLKTEHFPSPPQQWVRNSNAPPEREMVPRETRHPTESKANANNPGFVPLQAVRKQLTKNSSSSREGDPVKQNTAVKYGSNEKSEKSNKNVDNQNGSKASQDMKRRQRRMRLAANFSVGHH